MSKPFNNFYAGKKVFLTGHTGFKGSWLSKWLIELGADVFGYSSYIPSEPSNFEALNLKSQLKDTRGDIRELENLSNALNSFKPDIVFHLAAQPIVKESYLNPKTTFDVNLGGTVNMLEILRNLNFVKSAVMITSDKCYENVEWEYGYREDDKLGGKDPYSASKGCAEIAFSSYARTFFCDENSPNIATARAGNVIGGGDWAASRIVPDCIRAWSGDSEPDIRSPYATRPWQHVLEPLSGYLWLAVMLAECKEGTVTESFNFGPPADSNYTVEELIIEMGNTWESVKWNQNRGVGGAVKEAGLLKLCCDKALNRLAWKACLDFETTVKMTAEWYKAYYGGETDMEIFTSKQITAYRDIASSKGLKWARN